MNNKPIVWLDLEGTIIKSWQDFLYSGTTINIKEVRSWLIARNITEVNIFSAAIYDTRDKTIFLEQMKTDLEECLKVNIIQWPSIEDLMKSSKKFDFVEYCSVNEYIQLNGKFLSFLKYCIINGKNQNNILIDDCVANWQLIGDNGNTVIETINILTVTGKKW